VHLPRKAKPDSATRTVVFVTFENEFAPLGGLAAVMRELPRRMAQAEQGRCFTVTPFFRDITRCRPKLFAEIRSAGHTFGIRFGDRRHEVEIFQHLDKDGFRTFLLDSADFFNAPCDCGNPPAPEAPCNPYLNPSDPGQLLQDALFFCAAVPKALVELGKTNHLVLSLQDWEAACVALTVREEPRISSAASILTLHNPYDKPLSDADLGQISERRLMGPTVLTKVIPLLDGPLCTVSENFAAELVSDPLHTAVYAPHLQDLFKKRGIVGVNNGLFSQLDFTPDAIDAAAGGDFNHILAEKQRRRESLVEVLQEYTPREAWGSLGFSGFDGPIFLMFGRDDPRQKGYDVAAAAIRRIPKGKARYVFTPIPGDEGLDGLGFLRKLAHDRPGEVKVFPFRMAQGYKELQRGCSFIVMCSLYEPFGGATEGYAVGTPVVARATGGLVQQVAPVTSGGVSVSVRRLAEQFHPRNAPPSGFLFREPDLPDADVEAGWRTIVDCAYWPTGDRVADRVGTPLFDAMVEEATRAFLNAIELYANDETGYARMITNGFGMLDLFPWDRAVRGYQRIYDDVCH
jgi:glycogen synthase